MGIASYSTTPASNGTISGINIAEGCSPGGINDAIRQLMADLATDAPIKSNNLSDLTNTATALTNLGGLKASNNLSDLTVAATARTNLGLAIGTNVQAYSANIVFTNTNQTFTVSQRGAIYALTDGATITPDFNTSNDFSVTLGGNRTLANPTNLTVGQKGCFVITQDATGSRTIAFGSYYKWSGGTVPTLSTSASSVDRIQYHVIDATHIHCSFMGAFA
jgi:hypothetical protein